MSSSVSGLSHSRSVETPASASRSGRHSSFARELPLPDLDDDSDEEMNVNAREWAKAERKALDACFTDGRIVIASRLGMSVVSTLPRHPPTHHDLPPQPRAPVAPREQDVHPRPRRLLSFSTPPRRGLGATSDVVMMASADVVDLAAVVQRLMGGKHILREYGPSWEMYVFPLYLPSAGHVAPPTPRVDTAPTDEDTFASRNRRPSMEVPDFTPLGKRTMPPRKPRLPPPVTGGTPFSYLPSTPEPVRRRRVAARAAILALTRTYYSRKRARLACRNRKVLRDSDVEDDQSLVDERE
ncbi:hypothetical protein GGX14DRAFT_562020 [Mycena pura]|uniref:Uncharacterized protein n=1 Tax=Mycena pura TaxID=153505 RepID=A0AAD6VLH1_9AGAR|nr:hypothetical protein GGX14DRAFT_562020 [Mycena pura]